MTSDLEFLKSLGVPPSILAERAGRTITAITFEIEELESNGSPEPRQEEPDSFDPFTGGF